MSIDAMSCPYCAKIVPNTEYNEHTTEHMVAQIEASHKAVKLNNGPK